MTALPDPSAADLGGASPLAGYPIAAPPLVGRALITQRWAELTFIHWPVRVESVAHLFPKGTRPDTFGDGVTYVALVPFVMGATALGSSLPVPFFGAFEETNVRLYSVDDAGRHGVVFLSLETARLAVVPLVRAVLGVPYTWARMRITRSPDSADRVVYDSVRRWPRRGLHSRLTINVGQAVEPTPLEVWLTARWGAHTRKAGRTWWVPNEHEPWPLRAAEIVELEDDLVGASGLQPAGDPLRALFSPGVWTRFGRPIVVR